MDNRPSGRRRSDGGQGKDIRRRGEGLGTGPVGTPGGRTGNQGGTAAGGAQRSTVRAAGGKKSPILIIAIIVIAAIVIFGGKGLSGLFSGNVPSVPSFDIGSVVSGFSSNASASSWGSGANTGKLNTAVSPLARDKYTSVKGDGSDTVTIMVYMCGTDLESKSGMASSDLGEMARANLSDKVNLIVYTGGCTRWQTSGISNTVNQIYKVEQGRLVPLVADAGTSAMTNPANLTSFVTWCHENYPADRNMFIFWDHGGGSLSGYGYDEKNPNSGSMTLQGIGKAFADVKAKTGMYFDFIGFDACLMATLETALTLSPYTDYLIASEETEPGIGWYYTDWLNALCANTSLSTLEIGKNICDAFVSECAAKCAGQGTTLSVVDLAELERTVPEQFRSFAGATSEQLKSDFKAVSEARSSSREFAKSSKIDQVDLVNFAEKLGTDESKKLAEVLLSAVKYNRTSQNMTNAYGLSVYFPYQKTSKVDSAVAAYDAIGIDDEYSDCIRAFASMEVGGQAVSGGASSPLSSLLGGSFSSSPVGSDMISSLLGGLLQGNLANVAGLSSSNAKFLDGSLDVSSASVYLQNNRLDASALVWKRVGGVSQMLLTEEQWGLVRELELNAFYDDGAGYIDLGLDNIYEFTEEGGLRGAYDGKWLAVNGQPVAYYLEENFTSGSETVITGRIPVLLNGSRANLIVMFDNAHPNGTVVGARTDYIGGETETVAKALTELADGDTLDFVCDYYSYAGEYQDSYMLGERLTVSGPLQISDVDIDASRVNAVYRLTDIYNQHYWTPVIPD